MSAAPAVTGVFVEWSGAGLGVAFGRGEEMLERQRLDGVLPLQIG